MNDVSLIRMRMKLVKVHVNWSRAVKRERGGRRWGLVVVGERIDRDGGGKEEKGYRWRLGGSNFSGFRLAGGIHVLSTLS